MFPVVSAGLFSFYIQRIFVSLFGLKSCHEIIFLSQREDLYMSSAGYSKIETKKKKEKLVN